MSRLLSSRALRSALAQETGEVWLVLITLRHPAIDPPIRVTSDAVATVSRSETFQPYPFELTLADDDGEHPGTVRLSIDNVAREIVFALRSIDSAPTVTIEVVLASQPDAIEASWEEYSLVNVEYDALKVSGEISQEPILSERYPAGSFDPARFPGLF